MIVPFYPDRIRNPIYFASDYYYQIERMAYKGGSRIAVGNVCRDNKIYSSFFRLEYDGVRLSEEANLMGCMLGKQIQVWLEFESDEKISGFFRADRDIFTNKYCFEIWSNIEGGHSEKTRYAIDKGIILRYPPLDCFFSNGLEQLKTIRMSFCCRHKDTEIWDNNYGNIEYTTSTDEGFQKKSNYCIHLKPTILKKKDDTSSVIENKVFNIDKKNGYKVDWIFTTELSGNSIFFHRATLPPGTCQGIHIHEGTEELCYALKGEAIVQLKAEFAKDLEGEEILFKKGSKAGDNNSLECDTLIKEIPFKEGDSLLLQHGGIHGIRNTGKEDFSFLSFMHQY